MKQEGIRTSILKRSDYSFVVCYDLLVNEVKKHSAVAAKEEKQASNGCPGEKKSGAVVFTELNIAHN